MKPVVRKISLSEEDGGLGDVITATGKGYKNDTSLTVFLDKKVLVTWDDPDTTTSDAMVPLPGDRVDDYNALLMAADPEDHADLGNIPVGTIPTEEDDDSITHCTMTMTAMRGRPTAHLTGGMTCYAWSTK